MSAPVSLTVTPRNEARPIRDLVVQGSPDPGAMLATFTPVEGYACGLWELPREAGLPLGTRTTRDDLTRLKAQRLTTRPEPGGKQLLFDAPEGVTHVVALTETDNGYLVGATVTCGTAPPPTDVVAEAFGDELRLSWEWPAITCTMELAWEQAGHTRTRRFTRARYRSEGGAKVANAGEIERLTIATVVRADDDEWTSPAIPVPLPERGPACVVDYDLKLAKSLLGGKRHCSLTATTTTARGVVRADLVLANGSFMPLAPGDGRVVSTIELDFSTAPQATVEIPLGKLTSPFWVRLFPVDDSVEINDPPATDHMKG